MDTQMVDSDFERRLIDALQPVRGFVLAHALHFALHSDLWRLLASGPVGARELAVKLELEPRRLTVLLDYLVNEGYVLRQGEDYALTGRGADLSTFAPWYRLLVGGYTPTLASIEATLAAGAPFAGRDGAAIGQGSCGISAYDAIPMIRTLLSRVPRSVDRLVDLGCGDGSVLLALASDVPSAELVGVDEHPGSVAGARTTALQVGASATFHQSDGMDFVAALPAGTGTACYVAAFVLQEMLEQRGRTVVVDLIRRLLVSTDHGYLVAVEVDWQMTNASVMRHGLSLAYYNPYYLVHGLTEQRLASRDFWRQVVEAAGGKVIEVAEVDQRVDSTGLEFGYLIGRE